MTDLEAALPTAPQAPAPTAIAGVQASVQAATGVTRLLHLMWLASPALPVGGFSYSEVLESAVDRAGVDGEARTAAWLRDQLQLSLARSDLPAVALAIPAWQARDLPLVQRLNDWILQTRESQELRLQTEQMGRSLMDWLRTQAAQEEEEDMQVLSRACASPTYPIAFALAASRTRADTADCLASYAFGWCENMVQAAVRAVPLGQSAGQRILAQLVHAVPQALDAAQARAQQPEEMQAFSPMLAILSAQHETQYSRLFRS